MTPFITGRCFICRVKSDNIFQVLIRKIAPYHSLLCQFYATRDRAGSGGKEREESKIPIELDGFYKKRGMARTSRRPPPCAGQQRIEYCKMCPRERFNLSDFAINQLTESVRLEKRYIVMLKAQIRDPQY